MKWVYIWLVCSIIALISFGVVLAIGDFGAKLFLLIVSMLDIYNLLKAIDKLIKKTLNET